VLTGLDALPKSDLYTASSCSGSAAWASDPCVALLPMLGVGGMSLYRAEMPGP